MKIKFNPTGTTVRKGRLRLRLDVFPSPTDKTYRLHYVDDVDSKGEPTGSKRLNPCLSHFMVVPENVALNRLADFVTKRLFTPANLAILDEGLIREGSAHYISALMRGVPAFTNKQVKTTDIVDLLSVTKERLAAFALSIPKGSRAILPQPQSIDVGTPAIDQPTSFNNGRYTAINNINPANASGIINVVQTYWHVAGEAIEFATAFIVEGTNYSTRDYDDGIGDQPANSTQTASGLDIDVETGDFIMCGAEVGQLNSIAQDGLYYGGSYVDNIPCTDVAFSWYEMKISLYATGVEGGAVVEGSAAGSGIGLASSSAKLDVLASALGNGIGLSQAASHLIISATASGQGIGLATAQAILDVLAAAAASGEGLGACDWAWLRKKLRLVPYAYSPRREGGGST